MWVGSLGRREEEDEHCHLVVPAPRSTGSRAAQTALAVFSDFLDDASLVACSMCCTAWHCDGTTGKWAETEWARRSDRRVEVEGTRHRRRKVAFSALGLLVARSGQHKARRLDVAVAEGLRRECGRAHCCAKGRYLALTYVPALQRRRFTVGLRRDVEEARRRWDAEKAPFERRVEVATARLRLVSAVLAIMALGLLRSEDVALVALWPARFVWHVSRIARLAHGPLATYSAPLLEEKHHDLLFHNWSAVVRRAIASTHQQRVEACRAAWPLLHALLAPEALELRRYAFVTSVLLIVATCGLLLAWWRFVWYGLGAACASGGLSSLDVAEFELRLNKLESTSAAKRRLDDALLAERLHVQRIFEGPHKRFANPFEGLDDDDDDDDSKSNSNSSNNNNVASQPPPRKKVLPLAPCASSVLDGGLHLGLLLLLLLRRHSKVRRRSVLRDVGELTRPLLLLLGACAASTLLALALAVSFRENFGDDNHPLDAPKTPYAYYLARAQVALRYFLQGAWILALSVKDDIFPVLLVPPKFALNLCRLIYTVS